MPSTDLETQHRLRRRKRRMLAVLPASALVWGSLNGMPSVGADDATPGTMHTEIVTLTGSDAERTAAASNDVAAGSAPDALRSAPTAAEPGWSATVDVDDGTQAVAASWTGADHGAVEVRGEADGSWTAWTELHADPDEAPDDSVRDSGGMAWFGSDGVDVVEVRVAEGELADLEVQSMRYEEPSSGGITAALGPAVAGAAAAKPTILPRSSYTSKGWVSSNPGCSPGPTTASGGVKLAVVHHTVNSNTYSASDVPAMLASIYAYHTGTNRWCDVGYNFLVDRFGRTWEGRSGGVDKAIVGGHAAGFNTGTVGVSFLGQYEPGASPTAAQPTSGALDAAGKLIGWKLGLSGIDPTGTTSFTSGGSNKYPAGTKLTLPRVIGHRDVGYTACPGQNLYTKISTIRSVAKAAQGSTSTTTTTTTPPPTEYRPFASASALVTQQYADILFRQPSSSDLTYWSSRVGESWPPAQFVAHLASSSEADDRVHAVTRLYRAYFLRNPDQGGFTYWMNRRGDGQTLSRISSTFAGSSEFKNRYGTLSDAQFVDRVYRNVLGRAADSGGLSYWTRKLQGGTSRGQVMANFSQSSEYKAATKHGTAVVGLYATMLKRQPSADVYALASAALGNGSWTVTSLATQIWDSAEYSARFS